MPVRRTYQKNFDRTGRPYGPKYNQRGLFKDMGDLPGGGSEDPTTLFAALGATLFRFAKRYRIRSEARYRSSLAMVELVQEMLRSQGQFPDEDAWSEHMMTTLPALMEELNDWTPPFTFLGQHPGGPYPMRQGVWPDRKAINRARALGQLQVVEQMDDLPEAITGEAGMLVQAPVPQTAGADWMARYGFFLPASDGEAMLIWEWFPGMTRRTTAF